MPSSSSHPPVLDIQLLGRFVARIDGQGVDDPRWGRRSAKTLVKLLALAPAHALHREQVTEALWPELAPRTAANNLDKAIHGARRALEPGLAKGGHSRFILTPGSLVVLASPGELRVDTRCFEQAANQAVRAQDAVAARTALQLYPGALLVEDLFEEWTQAPRESLQQLFRATAVGAAERFAGDGDPASGLELARRLVQEDATDEHAHLLLMQLYAESGRRDQALLQFQACCKALRAAGLEVGAEATRWHQALLAEPAGAAPARARPSPASPLSLPSASPWSPHIVPISFRNGIVRCARSAPDGRVVLLSANWDGGRFGLYRLNPAAGSLERLPLNTDAADAEPLAVSPEGHLVVGLAPRLWNGFSRVSTLAVLPAGGRAPTVLLDGVLCADLHPGPAPDSAAPAGTPAWAAALAGRLAIVREVGGRSRLEFPIGQVRYETGGWLSHPRFSADGRHMAFIEHPIPQDDEGRVMVVDMGAEDDARALASGFLTIQGLAWRQGSVWFTASRKGISRSLYSVDLAGAEHPRYHGLGNLRLYDGTATGQLLISAERNSAATYARHASDAAEHDISWHERTTPRDIGADGQTLLIEEAGTAGRHDYRAYLRHIDGSATRMIADGRVPLVFSPDQGRVILRVPEQPSHLAVLDLASGAQVLLANDAASPLLHTEFVSFFPCGRRIAFSAIDRQGGLGIYTQDLAGGKPVCFAPGSAGLRTLCNRSVSPDGQRIVLMDGEGHLCLYQLADGRGAPLPGLARGFNLVGWTDDGEHLFVHQWDELPARISRYRLADGHLADWLVLSPRHANDVKRIPAVRLSPDGRSYAYSARRAASDLYLFEEH